MKIRLAYNTHRYLINLKLCSKKKIPIKNTLTIISHQYGIISNRMIFFLLHIQIVNNHLNCLHFGNSSMEFSAFSFGKWIKGKQMRNIYERKCGKDFFPLFSGQKKFFLEKKFLFIFRFWLVNFNEKFPSRYNSQRTVVDNK